MHIRLSLVLALAAMTLAARETRAADPQAAQAVFQKECIQCHEVVDWKGKTAAQLASLMTDVNTGKHKHPKKLQLTDAQIADLAAWASASNGS